MMLEKVDMTLKLSREEYVDNLKRLQKELFYLSHELYVKGKPAVVLFEGWDAAGKGGAIKRLTEGLDPRGYVVWPIAAPAGEDKERHYLYRFWRRLPEKGQIAIFDRTWYGRVLVERVEGFAAKAAWMRAYDEINYFERQLSDFGTIVIKFWIHISDKEQLRRFNERKNSPYKSWKLTDEDWRNREKRKDYEAAIEEMFKNTDTDYAPWTLVEADDKFYARIKILKTVEKRLKKEL